MPPRPCRSRAILGIFCTAGLATAGALAEAAPAQGSGLADSSPVMVLDAGDASLAIGPRDVVEVTALPGSGAAQATLTGAQPCAH